MTIQYLVGNLPGCRLVSEFKRVGTEPLNSNDGHEAIGQNASYGGIRLKVFQNHFGSDEPAA